MIGLEDGFILQGLGDIESAQQLVVKVLQSISILMKEVKVITSCPEDLIIFGLFVDVGDLDVSRAGLLHDLPHPIAILSDFLLALEKGVLVQLGSHQAILLGILDLSVPHISHDRGDH